MLRKILLINTAVFLLAACSPEPGSKAWCQAMEEQPKGDWTANEAGEYATSCLFNSEED